MLGQPAPPATPSTASPPGWRPPPARSGRALATRSAWPWPPAGSAACSTPTRRPGTSPFDHHIYVFVLRRRHRGGHQPRGLARSPAPAARQPDRCSTTTTHLHRGRHQHRQVGGRRGPVRGLRLARAAGELAHGRRLPRGRREALYRAFVAAREQHRPALVHRAADHHRLAGAEQAEHRRGARVRAGRGGGGRDQEDPRLRPRGELPRRGRGGGPRPPGRRPRQAGCTPSGTRSSPPGRRRTRSARQLLDRLAARRLPDGWAGALPVLPAGPEGRGHPEGLRQGAQRAGAGAARAVGRLGRPGRQQRHHHEGRAVLHPGRAPDRDVPGQPVRPDPALRHPRARHGRDLQRHRAARRHPALRRHVPGVQRLHAARGAARRADGSGR